MSRRNYKYFIQIVLACFGIILGCLWIAGCSDNPEDKAAKNVRKQTTEAVQTALKDKNYQDAQLAVESSLGGGRIQGTTRDVVLLASGNLQLAKGQQMQADLKLKVLPLRGSTDELEKFLRKSEELLLEKERIEAILTSGEQEIAELQQLLDGTDQKQALTELLAQETSQLDELKSQRAVLQEGKGQVQMILDQNQAEADALKRQAELAKGDKRLSLEKEASGILLKRKDYYIKLQEAENNIAVLDGEIELVRVRVDGLTQNIQEIQDRIEAIDDSESRQALKRQLRQVEESLSVNKQRISEIVGDIQAGLRGYRDDVKQLCGIYEEAAGEFSDIRSVGTQITAAMRLAGGYHSAAIARSAFIRTRNNLADRLQGLIETTDSSFVSMLQSGLSIGSEIDSSYEKKTFEYFDQAVEAYEKAVSQSGSLGTESICSLMKSELLALHSKMQLADLLGQYELANTTETAMEALIQKGSELGVCFTQSEAMRVVQNEGLDYLPSIPLNMEVFIDGKKEELSAWKGFRLQEQEAAIDENLQKIEDLIAQYGQDVASQLEPLKQEMLAAKERGFEEPAPGSGVGEPNSLF